MGGASSLPRFLPTRLSLLHTHSVSLYDLGRQPHLSLPRLSSLVYHRRHYNLTLSPPLPQSINLFLSYSQRICTQANSINEDLNHYLQQHHPWPEWSKLVHSLPSAAVVNENFPEDAFVSYDKFSPEFVRSASACLAFARNRPDILGLLSRKDIEVLVENGTPFLFRSALDTGRRMRSFLGSSGVNVLESDKANTVDLMKYILSYASNPILSLERNNFHSRELIEPSVRNLLHELIEASFRVPVSNLFAPEQYQVSSTCGQSLRPLGQNIEMKRGDWICPKCSFMNFARNVKCLECEEPRPKRQLTGGEWECPQCDFFNYGRNAACLRCDCKRPSEASFGTTNSRIGLVYNNEDYANKGIIDSRLIANEEKAQRWFSKVSQLNNASDLSMAAADEDFPEIMPLRKGVNRFVVSTRKTPLERRLAYSKYKKNSGKDGLPEGNNSYTGGANKNLDASVGRRLDHILSRTSTLSETDNRSINGQDTGTISSPALSGSGSLQYEPPKANYSGYAPFVPLPPDMFAKNPQISNMKDSEKIMKESGESVYSEANYQRHPVSMRNESAKSDNASPNHEPSTGNQWTGRGIWNLNYSVDVERPSTGSQTQNSQAVGNDSWISSFTRKDNVSHASPLVDNPKETAFASQSIANKCSSRRYSGDLENTSQSRIPSCGNPTQNSFSSQPVGNLAGSTTHPTEIQNVKSGWTGKSLDGSAAVKEEPDPLDMSEEAKAERWFRRVAQIKDISELKPDP